MTDPGWGGAGGKGLSWILIKEGIVLKKVAFHICFCIIPMIKPEIVIEIQSVGGKMRR